MMKNLKIGLTAFLMTIILFGFQNCAIVNSPEALVNAGRNSSSSASGISESAALSAKANLILTTKCQSCHNGSSPAGNFNVSDLNAMFYYRHIVPGEPLLSGLYSVVASGEMPPAPNPLLTAEELQDLYSWIQDGFNDVPNTTTPGTPPGAPMGVQPTFSSLSRNVFQPKCMSCHGSGTAFGGISFASFNSTRSTVTAGNAAVSGLYISVTAGRRGGRMPQGGGALSNAEVSAIQTWIQQGAMNN